MADPQVTNARQNIAVRLIDESAVEIAATLGIEWGGLVPIHPAHPDISRVQRFEAIANLLQEVAKRVKPAPVSETTHDTSRPAAVRSKQVRQPDNG